MTNTFTSQARRPRPRDQRWGPEAKSSQPHLVSLQGLERFSAAQSVLLNQAEEPMDPILVRTHSTFPGPASTDSATVRGGLDCKFCEWWDPEPLHLCATLSPQLLRALPLPQGLPPAATTGGHRIASHTSVLGQWQ